MSSSEMSWLRSKGYIHITGQIDTSKHKSEIAGKVSNSDYVSKHAFFPLIHTNIIERKYKKIDSSRNVRAHSYVDENGNPIKNTKTRPLHYATHIDALIFGYYAHLLQEKYEHVLSLDSELTNAIIAYRRIPLAGGKNKSTIHFAKEVFDEIKKRAANEQACSVFAFDIKSFFSTIDHNLLKNAWAKLLGKSKLPEDHYNVYKAATTFSYIYLDDLRQQNGKGRKAGFDEKELARIRNKFGINAFFESPKAFRDQIKEGKLKLYKFPFRNKKTKEPIGIPQGLPISAVLANLYLLEFDIEIVENVVKRLGGYYRRYSDDIVVVCSGDCAEEIESIITTTLEKSKVEISKNKTEKFLFRTFQFGNREPRLTSIKLGGDKEIIGAPFNYLGFEFNGHKALIKSTNLAKFYRRMISSVKRKARRAKKIAARTPGEKPIIFRRQLYKLYTTRPLSNTKVRSRWKKIVKIENGDYRIQTGIKKKVLRSNYLTYVRRASEIMEEPGIKKQIRKHKVIFNQAIFKHLKT